jgi:hypothetical protein
MASDFYEIGVEMLEKLTYEATILEFGALVLRHQTKLFRSLNQDEALMGLEDHSKTSSLPLISYKSGLERRDNAKTSL